MWRGRKGAPTQYLAVWCAYQEIIRKLFEQSLWISSVVEQHYQGCTIRISFTYAPNVHHYIYKGTERDVGIMR